MMKMFAIIALFMYLSLPSTAATITAASCLQSDVQSAMNSAASGDTVKTPGPCTVAWSGLTFPSAVGITLDGGGNTTVTSSAAVILQSSTSTSSRLTGFIFTNSGDNNNGDVKAQGGQTNATYRIDHNTFPNANTVIATWNNAPGLIDHNTFTGGVAAEMIHNFAGSAGCTSCWTDDITPGGPAMLFVEDNTFNGPSGSAGSTSAIQNYYGSRTVFRHNTIHNAKIDVHGTCGNVYGRWTETYENTWNVQSGDNLADYIEYRGGTGVIFNNHVALAGGSQGGAGNIHLREDCTSGTYPSLGQIGRGISQKSSALYMWGNDSSMNLFPDCSWSCIQQNRDFFVSASQPSTLTRCESAADVSAGCNVSYNYVPYPYPHPLQNSSSIAPPTGLADVVH